MRLLQSGMPKSGNFWLWQILQLIIKEASLPNESFIQKQAIHAVAKQWELSYKEQADIDTIDVTKNGQFYRISSIFRMPILDFDAYVAQTNHVWTHSNFEGGMPAILPKFDKIVYIVRDPRDVLLSQARFAFTPYFERFYGSAYPDAASFVKGELTMQTRRWFSHVGQHLLHREQYGIHVLFYENMLANFKEELHRLLNYLGVSLDEAAIQRIVHAANFETMKQENPNHVQKGQSYKWLETLSQAQQEEVIKITGRLLSLLGYPLRAGAVMTLPSLDSADFASLATMLKQESRKPLYKRIVHKTLNLLK